MTWNLNVDISSLQTNQSKNLATNPRLLNRLLNHIGSLRTRHPEDFLAIIDKNHKDGFFDIDDGFGNITERVWAIDVKARKYLNRGACVVVGCTNDNDQKLFIKSQGRGLKGPDSSVGLWTTSRGPFDASLYVSGVSLTLTEIDSPAPDHTFYGKPRVLPDGSSLLVDEFVDALVKISGNQETAKQQTGSFSLHILALDPLVICMSALYPNGYLTALDSTTLSVRWDKSFSYWGTEEPTVRSQRIIYRSSLSTVQAVSYTTGEIVETAPVGHSGVEDVYEWINPLWVPSEESV